MKKIDMTRKKREALPTVLAAARAATRHVPMTGAQKERLEAALEEYNDC